MDTLVDALATFRITKLIQEDTFPPIVALRERVIYPKIKKGGSLEELMECPWCLSFWVAIVVVLLRKVAPKKWDYLSKALAMSAVTGIINERG